MRKPASGVKRGVTRTRAPYLTKAAVVSASRRAIKTASANAMQVAGYVVKAENGWIVRENADGTVEKIERIKNYKKHPSKIALD